MRIRLIHPSFAAALGILLAPIAQRAIHAADFLVPSQYPTIQAAVNASSGSGTIKVAPGIYSESVSVNLINQSAGQVLRIECSDPNGYFTMTPTGRAITTVPTGDYSDRLEIVGCRVMGGAIVSNSPSIPALGGAFRLDVTCMIDRCLFEGCTVFNEVGTAEGGAIYIDGFVTATISRCTFLGNSATVGSTTATSSPAVLVAAGGAVAMGAYSGSVSDCIFESNLVFAQTGATPAPEVIAVGGAIRTDLPVTRCDFVGNRAAASSGAVATKARAIGGAIGRERRSAPLDEAFITRCRFFDSAAITYSGNPSGGGAGDALGGAIGSRSRDGFPVAVRVTDSIFLFSRAEKQPEIGVCRVAADVASDGLSSTGLPGIVLVERCRFSHSSWSTAPSFVAGSVVPSAIPPAASWGYAQVKNSSFCAMPGEPLGPGITPTNVVITSTCQDCDGDGVEDLEEIVLGSEADTNYDGLPDNCESTHFVPSHYPTIQAAIAAVPSGATRVVRVAAGTYAGPIDFGGKNIAVLGSGAATCTIAGSAGETKSVVRMTGEPATARLEGFTIRGGLTGTPLPGNESALVGGGIFAQNSQASIVDCVVESNTAGFGGGAYLIDCSGAVTGCVFRDNLANAYGGGVQLFRCSTLLDDCAFEGNTAVANGGGIHVALGTATVRASSISQNLAYSGGGGLSWDAGGSTAWSLRLEDSLVTKNSAQSGVGGVRVFPNPQVPTLAIVASEVCGNAGGNIDGFYSADAASTVCECAGDIDASGVINGVDLSALLSVWGTAGVQYPRADANRDGLVSAADLAILLSNWGPCAP